MVLKFVIFPSFRYNLDLSHCRLWFFLLSHCPSRPTMTVTRYFNSWVPSVHLLFETSLPNAQAMLKRLLSSSSRVRRITQTEISPHVKVLLRRKVNFARHTSTVYSRFESAKVPIIDNLLAYFLDFTGHLTNAVMKSIVLSFLQVHDILVPLTWSAFNSTHQRWSF